MEYVSYGRGSVATAERLRVRIGETPRRANGALPGVSRLTLVASHLVIVAHVEVTPDERIYF